MTGQGGPWTKRRRIETGRRLKHARYALPLTCLGGGHCFLVRIGLRACTRVVDQISCGIRRARNDAEQWSRVERLAASGNRNSQAIVGHIAQLEQRRPHYIQQRPEPK